MNRDLFGPPAIVKPADALAELATRINAEHQEVETALRAGMEHAKSAGELLLEAKKQCGHGRWLPWLKANVKFSERTAQAYMRIAKRWEELEAKAQHVADLPYRDGLKLLTEPPPSSPLEILQDAAASFREASAAMQAGNPPPSLEGTVKAVKEAKVSLLKRLGAPVLTIEEAKSIRDTAAALEIAAAENKLRVERKLGELLAELPEQAEGE